MCEADHGPINQEPINQALTPAEPPGLRLSRRTLVAGALAVPAGVGVGLASVTPASAYDWPRTLQRGMTGNDVKELQVRVAGWAADSPTRVYIAVDGDFGPATEGAVKRFQASYGLSGNGVANTATLNKLNDLEQSDGSTLHFNFSEFYSKDGSGFNGGKVGASTVKANVRRLMWKLEALRRKRGNNAVNINSGFRSIAHNSAVGGASNSQHMYGITADFTVNGSSPSQVNSTARTCGFSGIILYSSFNHCDSRVEYPYGAQSWYWGTA